MSRVILHLDMDAFFASVEQRDFPHLRGRPVLVGGGRGGEGKRGVVTTASYEARVFGCRSAMPMAQARLLCSQALIQPVRMDVYADVSRIVMDVLREVSPAVQPVSIDEAFADLSGVLHLHGCPSVADESAAFAAARRIAVLAKSLVRVRVDLPCSIGLAASKSLAKIASDMNKPDGLGLLPPSQALDALAPMPVGVLHTLGPKAQATLQARGVRTIAELRAAGLPYLEREFGASGRFWWNLAHARDDRPVQAERDNAKSVSKERTFSENVSSADQLRQVLAQQIEETARRLRADKLRARRITLKLRLGDFSTFSRSRTLPEPTDRTQDLLVLARALFKDWLAERRGPIRLLGTSLGDLSLEGQLDLFSPAPSLSRSSQTDAATDAIVARFGRNAILRGGAISQPPPMDRGAETSYNNNSE